MKSYLCDMDGVLIHGRRVVPGAPEFLRRLQESGTEYLVLTNNSIYTPRDLAHRLQTSGLDIPSERIFTSSMATGKFLQTQKTNGPGTAFVIGESGLTQAVHEAGFIITDHNPEYAVLGETLNYNFEQVTKATRLVAAGAHFIATNPDVSGPAEEGIVPACGAMAALIERASGRSPLFIGKPNPLMMRLALNHLGVHSENTVMIGDRMDTDIIAGVQSGMETVLVLSGITRREDVRIYPYKPTSIVDSVAQLAIR